MQTYEKLPEFEALRKKFAREKKLPNGEWLVLMDYLRYVPTEEHTEEEKAAIAEWRRKEWNRIEAWSLRIMVFLLIITIVIALCCIPLAVNVLNAQ